MLGIVPYHIKDDFSDRRKFKPRGLVGIVPYHVKHDFSTDANSNHKSPSRRTSAETREHILAVAEKLFYWDGIRSTGIDTLAARAEVAPTTLYRLFASKDDLVAAYVERCSDRYKAVLSAATSPTAGTPRDRILAILDAFTDDVRSESCRGCPFLMVLAEYPDPHSTAHAKAVAHKAWVRDLFHDLVGELSLTTKLAIRTPSPTD